MKSLLLIFSLLFVSNNAHAKMDCSTVDTSAFVKQGEVGGAAEKTIYRFDVIRDALLDSVDQPDLLECIDGIYQKGLMDETKHWAGQLTAAGCERLPNLKIGGPHCDKKSQAYKSTQYLINLDEEVASDLGKVKRASVAAREKESALATASCPAKDPSQDLGPMANGLSCCGTPDNYKSGAIEIAWPGKADNYKECIAMTGHRNVGLDSVPACLANALWGIAKGMWSSVASLGKLAGGAWDYVTHPGKMVGAMGKIASYLADAKFFKQTNDKIMAALSAYFNSQVGAFQCMNGHYRMQFMCDKGGQIIGMFATQNAIGKLLSLATEPLSMVVSGISDMVKGTKVGQALVRGGGKAAAATKAGARAVRDSRLGQAAGAAGRLAPKIVPGVVKTAGRWVLKGGKMTYVVGKATTNLVGRPLTVASEKAVAFVLRRPSYKFLLDRALRFQEAGAANLESKLLAGSTTVGAAGSTIAREAAAAGESEAATAAGSRSRRETSEPRGPVAESRGSTESSRGSALEPSGNAPARANVPPRLALSRDKLNNFTRAATENMTRSDAARLLGSTKRDVATVAHDLHRDVDALAAAGEYTPAKANQLHDAITEAQRVASKAKAVKAWPRLREEPVASEVATAVRATDETAPAAAASAEASVATAESPVTTPSATEPAPTAPRVSRKPVPEKDWLNPPERKLVSRTGSDPVELARGAPLEPRADGLPPEKYAPRTVTPLSPKLTRSKEAIESFVGKAGAVEDEKAAQVLFQGPETGTLMTNISGRARWLRREIDELAENGTYSAERAAQLRNEVSRMERLAYGKEPIIADGKIPRAEEPAAPPKPEKEPLILTKADEVGADGKAIGRASEDPPRPFAEGEEPPARMSDDQMNRSKKYLEGLDQRLRKIGSGRNAQYDARRAFHTTREDKLRKEVDSLHEQIDQLALNNKINNVKANEWHSNVALGESYANGTASVRTWAPPTASVRAGPIKIAKGEPPSSILSVSKPEAPTSVFTPAEKPTLLGDGAPAAAAPISGSVTPRVTYNRGTPSWSAPKQEIPVPGASSEIPRATGKGASAKTAVVDAAEDVARRETASTLLDRDLSADEQAAVTNIANMCSEEKGRVMSFACRVRKTWVCKRAFAKDECKKLMTAKVFGTPEGGMPAAVEAQLDTLAQVDSQTSKLQATRQLVGDRLKLYKKLLGNAISTLAKKQTVTNKTLTTLIAMKAVADGTATPEQTQVDHQALAEDRQDRINAANMAKYGPDDSKFNEGLVMLNLQPDEVTASLESKGITSVTMDESVVRTLKESSDGSGIKALRSIHRGFTKPRKSTAGIVRSTTVPGLVKVRMGKTNRYLLGCYSEFDQAVTFKQISTQAPGTSIDQASGGLCDDASAGGL